MWLLWKILYSNDKSEDAFMISLSSMDNLDMNHQTGWFSDIFSTWNTFESSDWLILWYIFHMKHIWIIRLADLVIYFPHETHVPSIQYCVWNFCHTYHICIFQNPLWTFSICTLKFFFPIISFPQILHLNFVNSQSVNHVHMHEVGYWSFLFHEHFVM